MSSVKKNCLGDWAPLTVHAKAFWIRGNDTGIGLSLKKKQLNCVIL